MSDVVNIYLDDMLLRTCIFQNKKSLEAILKLVENTDFEIATHYRFEFRIYNSDDTLDERSFYVHEHYYTGLVDYIDNHSHLFISENKSHWYCC